MSDDWGPWVGASGTEYNFNVYGRDDVMPSRQGVYIYCRKDAQGLWMPVYVGQGDLALCCDDPDRLACIDAKGATHVHMRLCASAAEREAEAADLLERYRNAFAPWGCNVGAPEARVGAGAGTGSVAAPGAAASPDARPFAQG